VRYYVRVRGAEHRARRQCLAWREAKEWLREDKERVVLSSTR